MPCDRQKEATVKKKKRTSTEAGNSKKNVVERRCECKQKQPATETGHGVLYA